MKKRVLSVLLALTMTLGLLPVGVLAMAGSPHTHDGVTFDHVLTGGEDENDRKCLLKDGSLLDGTYHNQLPDGNYYLAGNAAVSEGVCIGDYDGNTATVNLCLNGKTLDVGDRGLSVYDGSKLTLFDCSDGQGVIQGNSEYSVVSVSGGRNGPSELLIEGGRIVNAQGEGAERPGTAISGEYITLRGGEVSGPYGVSLGFYNETSSLLTLEGAPKIDGSIADICILYDNSLQEDAPALIDATAYTGEPVSIEFTLNLDNTNFADFVGAPLVKLDSTPASKFTLTNAGYFLEEKAVGGVNCLVLAQHVIAQQPIKDNSYTVTAPDASGYQWYTAKAVTKTVVDGDAGNSDTTVAANGSQYDSTTDRWEIWIGKYFSIDLTEGDKLTVTFPDGMPSSGMMNLDCNAEKVQLSHSFGDNTPANAGNAVTFAIEKSGTYTLSISGQSGGDPAISAMRTHPEPDEPVSGQTSATLTAAGGSYICRVTWPDGKTVDSNAVTLPHSHDGTEFTRELTVDADKNLLSNGESTERVINGASYSYLPHPTDTVGPFHYYLGGTGDTLTSSSRNVRVNGDVALCLNGKTWNTGKTIVVNEGKKLTVRDCGENGTISKAGQVLTVYGEFVLENGAIAHTGSDDNAAIWNAGGCTTLKGGTVEGPYAVEITSGDGTESPLTLTGASTLAGTKADVKLSMDIGRSGTLQPSGTLPPIDAAGYTGEDTVTVTLGSAESALGKPIVKVNAGNAGKFTCVTKGYCLTPKEGDATVLVLAVQPAHTHPICGGSCAHEGEGAHTDVGFDKALTGDADGKLYIDGTEATLTGTNKTSYILPAGNYYLAGDIETAKNIKVSGTVNLCFNGHTLTYDGGSARGAFITVQSGAALNTCDCQTEAGGVKDTRSVIGGTEMCILDLTYQSEAALYGGAFDGTAAQGGAHVAYGGKLTVDGADVTTKGTALYVQQEGQLTIKSGTLKADQPSDGVVVTHSTEFTMEGGTIATDTSHTGVCFAKNGGGGGDNAGDGGGTIRGGIIQAGTGIKVEGEQAVTLSGAPEINAGTAIWFVTQTKNLLQVGDDLTGQFSVKYYFDVNENNPYTFTAPAGMDQSGHFTSKDNSLSIRDVVDEATGKHTVQLYKPAQQSHTHAVSVGCETDSGEQVTFRALTSENDALYVDGVAAEVSNTHKAYMLPAGNYYLAGDVRLDRQIRLTRQAQGADLANSTVNFCLNGYKLEYAGDDNNSPVIYVGTNTYALNICDCDPTGTDRTGNVIDDPLSGYTKVIWGGVITGGRMGGVSGSAPVTLYGGAIAGNTGSYGGGVSTDNFVMRGGAVTYNKALYGGGVNATGSFTMTGGTISGNWAKTKNGGVHTVISSGTPAAVTLSGSAKITGNVMGDSKTTASNLNLVSGSVVTVGPEGLGEAFQVGISTSTVPTASAPVTVVQGSGDTALTAAELAKFSSDNSNYELKLSNGKIVLTVKSAAHVHNWATAWSNNAAGHWHACTASGCGITDYANCGETGAAYGAHVYDNAQDATCNTCGYTRTVTPEDPNPPTPGEGETEGKVEVKPGTPAVTVDEDSLKALAGETQAGQTVTVKLTVEAKEAPADQTELDAVIQGEKDDVLYLDLSLLKTTTQAGNAPATEAITDTGTTVLEIAVPYDFTGKKDVTAYRKHGSEPAQALTKLTSRPGSGFADGSFFADSENGVVYIYASKFSTYAIGYTAEEAEPDPTPTPSGDSGTVPNTYKPNLQQPEHGKLTVSPAAPSKGKTVTVTVKPEDGYEVESITVTDRSGKAVEVTRNANGTYSYTQPSGRVNISAVMKEAGTASGDEATGIKFVDVRETAWYYDDVYYCAEKGLMQGREDNAFDPEITTSRAMIATILWRMAGSPEAKTTAAYPDCEADTWYTQAVAWADEAGVVKGYGSSNTGSVVAGNFGPNDPITREQLALMLYRYAKAQGMDVSVGENTNILSYKDIGELGDWAMEAVQWAAGAGIVGGKPDGLLDPKGQAMRAEAAAMLRRFCELGK